MFSRRVLASSGATSARAGPGVRDRRASLKWQRLKPYEKFAAMIDRHWDGIAAYCRLENKVSLGFVEGLNNKIRVIQRRALWLAQRGLPSAQNPDLHAARSVAVSAPRTSYIRLTADLTKPWRRPQIRSTSKHLRYGHDEQRKRVAHMPTATTSTAVS